MDEVLFLEKLTPYDHFKVHHKFKAYFYGFIISLSAFYFGYSLTIAPAIPITLISSYYSINIPKQYILAAMSAALPFGGAFGSLLVSHIFSLTSKRNLYFILPLFTIMFCSLALIQNFYCLLLNRFLLGFFVAVNNTLSGNYIKQLFFFKQRKIFGAIISCGRTAGMFFSFLLPILIKNQSQFKRIFFSSFALSFISIFQTILVVIFLPNSPGQYLSEDKVYIAKKVKCSYHIAVLRNFCGASFVVMYSGQIMRQLGFKYAQWTPVFMNSIQFLSGVMGVFFVQIFRRDRLIVVGTILIGFINLFIAIADCYQYTLVVFFLLGLYMLPCASCITSVVWSLPSEIANKNTGKYVSIVSWTTLMISTVTPPIITALQPQKNAYPFFLFISLYLGIANFMNIFTVLDLPYQLALLSRQSRM